MRALLRDARSTGRPSGTAGSLEIFRRNLTASGSSSSQVVLVRPTKLREDLPQHLQVLAAPPRRRMAGSAKNLGDDHTYRPHVDGWAVC